MLALFIVFAATSASTSSPDCREVGIDRPDGSFEMKMMCRGADGKWKPAPAETSLQTSEGPSSQPVLPAKAEVTYQGTYQMRLSSAARVPSSLPSSLNLGSIARAVSGSVQDNGHNLEGTVTMRAVFDGPSVIVNATGTGGIRGARLSGLVRSGQCHLVSDDQSVAYDGQCGPQGFAGSISTGPRNRETVSGRFDMTTSAFVDVAQRQQQQQAAAAAAQVQREKDRAAAVARIAAMPSAGPAYTTKVAGFVQADSKGWAFNHFDAGSVHNVKVASGSLNSGNFVLRGEYTFNGGNAGWVMVQYSSGKFDCLQFWDAMVGCRALRTAADGQAMRGAAISLMSGGGSGSSSRCNGSPSDCENARFNNWVQQNRSDGLNDNGTPK